jgi:HK97 family phage portal protein
MSGIFTRMLAKPEKRADENWEKVVLESWRSNAEAVEGTLTPDSSMRLSTVYSCVRILAETIASLPLLIYEKIDRGKQRAQNFYLYELLHDRPNGRMTAFEYREVVQSHLALWGNAYSHIIYDSQGRIEELWPLHPAGILQVQERAGVLYYLYQPPYWDPYSELSMFPTGKANWYSEAEIWHLHGLGDDGQRGYSPIALMRRAVSLGLNAEKYSDNFFRNDARPGIVIEHPAALSDPAYERLRAEFENKHGGVKNAHKPMILEEGMKLHEVGIPPKDAQFLETRKFQVEEICRIFRVPPHMVADLDRATFSNIEQQSIEFVKYSVTPWLERWEQSIEKNLMLPDERRRYFVEHLVDGMLRGDIKSRYDSYALGRQNGWLSANDIRDMENMNPVEGGDAYLIPLNMTPAGEAVNPENDGNADDE